MGLFIIIASTLVIWACLVSLLFVTISFARYAWQEMRHDLRNAKRFIKEMLIDFEWACKHNKKGNVNYEHDYE